MPELRHDPADSSEVSVDQMGGGLLIQASAETINSRLPVVACRVAQTAAAGDPPRLGRVLVFVDQPAEHVSPAHATEVDHVGT
jgi:hypothetical protein